MFITDNLPKKSLHCCSQIEKLQLLFSGIETLTVFFTIDTYYIINAIVLPQASIAEGPFEKRVNLRCHSSYKFEDDNYAITSLVPITVLSSKVSRHESIYELH